MELKIEKMIYGGDGLARLPVEGSPRPKTVFVPFVLAGEEVSAVLTQEKAGFNRATAGRIITKSPDRIEPGCQYFYRCGGCHYQHARYEHQVEIKRAILLETLRRQARIDHVGDVHVHPSPPWNYRNRTRLHVALSPDFTLGYYRFNSRDLLPVGECPISSPLINRAMEEVWRMGRIGPIPVSTEEIEFFVDAEDTELLIELYTTYQSDPVEQRTMETFAESISTALPQVKGITAFVKGSTLFPWDTAAWNWGATELLYKSQHGDYHVQAGSFFQTNRFLIDTLIDAVVAQSGTLALDLYAGTGLFSVPLAARFKNVVAVEPAVASFADLKKNKPANVEAFQLTTEEYLRQYGAEAKPDLIVVDPPRAGLDERVTRALIKMSAPRLTYVSCDPATLARDLRMLTDVGYRINGLHLLDMFPQTFHMETVVHLAK